MAIRKPSPPEHLVVCDTNILWHEDKSVTVHPDFDTFWDNYSSSFPMKLILPEVVRGELLFQQSTSAAKHLAKANQSIQDISKITEKVYSHRITPDRIKAEVTERFDRWVHAKKAEIKATPIPDIDWSAIIESSIWRVSPFTPDPQNPKNEKGFRDSLILETVCAICKFYSDDVNIAFICNDFSLRKAAENRLSHLESVSIYESLKDFESFIELTKKNLTERFVKSILSRARGKFFTKGEGESLLYKDNLYSRLRTEFKSKIESPESPNDVFANIFAKTSSVWNHIGNEQVWIHHPQFTELTDENIYHWKSQVVFVRLYERPDSMFSINQPIVDRRLLVLTIDVRWQAAVRADGRFFDCKIVDYIESSNTFKAPTEDELERYGLQKKVEQGDATTP